MMSKVADNLERDMIIVGLTAIEDKLQDGVSDTIADLATGGIKFCVLTGVKLETAINIDYSCKVLREDQLLLQLTSGASVDIEAGLARLYKAVTDKKGMSAEFYEAKTKPSRRPAIQSCSNHRHRAKDVASAWDVMLKHYPNLPTLLNAAALHNHNRSISGVYLSPSRRRLSQASFSISLGPVVPAAPAIIPNNRPIHVRFTQAAESIMVGKKHSPQRPHPQYELAPLVRA
ncbi:hypothetical protein VYU27_000544 [Nannochloropsis oceanica]